MIRPNLMVQRQLLELQEGCHGKGSPKRGFESHIVLDSGPEIDASDVFLETSVWYNVYT